MSCSTYLSQAPDSARLRVRRKVNGRPSHQCFVGFSHPLSSRFPVVPFENNLENLVSGLKERVLYLDTRGTERPRFTADSRVLFELAERLGRLVSPHQVSWEHFVSTRPGSKRKLYEQALCQLKNDRYSLKRLAETKLFTKFERTWWTKPQVPRVINPRDPRYHILLGSYLHGIERHCFDALQQLLAQNVPCIAKGHSQETKALHIKSLLRPGWKCIGLDASRFDQCIGEEALRIEHTVYNTVYHNPELAALLECQLHNVGRYKGRDGSLRCDMGAIRCSGDVNTSLGNCIISVLFAHAYCLEHGIKHRVYCDGDDLLLFVPSSTELDTLQQWYLQRGLRMKVEPPAFILEDVEFCQGKVVYCSDRWVLVRNPVKCLTTDYTGFLDCTHDRVWRHIVHATGSCGLSLFSGCPILQEWYLWGLRNGRSAGLKLNRGQGLADYYLRAEGVVKRKAQPVTEEARASFCLAWGITPAQQLAVEAFIQGMECGVDVITSNLYQSTFSEILRS